MTTDLEKKFFDTFGIPQLCCKKYITNCGKYGECEECENYDNKFSTYPQITDTHYLKLVCMLLNVLDGMDVYVNYDVEKVKEKTLRLLVTFQDDVYSQVQELFKGK